MPKQVSGGQEAGDLGKPLAGQKRALEENMQGAGDTVVGRMATRSSKKSSQDHESTLDFKMFKEWAKNINKEYKTAEEEFKRFEIWLSFKEWVDAKNSRRQPGGVTYGLTFFADLTKEEQGGFYKRHLMGQRPQPLTIHKSKGCEKMEKQLAEEKVAFDKWVAEHKRNYGSELERMIAFSRYKTNTRWIDSLIKENPGKYSTPLTALSILFDQTLSLSEVESLLVGCTVELLYGRDVV